MGAHFDQFILLSLELLLDGDLLLEFLSSGLELVIDVAVPDGIVALLDELLSSNSVDLLDHEGFLVMILVLS